MVENPLPTFAEEVQSDAKAGIGSLCSGDGLEKQVHGGTSVQSGQLGGNMSQYAGLSRNTVARNQSIDDS